MNSKETTKMLKESATDFGRIQNKNEQLVGQSTEDWIS